MLTTLETIHIEPKSQLSQLQNFPKHAIIKPEPSTKQAAAMKLE